MHAIYRIYCNLLIQFIFSSFSMPILDNGVDRILNQVINPKVYSAFVPQVEDAVYNMLGIEKPVKESKPLLNGIYAFYCTFSLDRTSN